MRTRLPNPIVMMAALLAMALIAGDAFAQRQRQQQPANEFPNATRTEPKLQTTRAIDDIRKAYDALENDQNDRARELLEKVRANARASRYEQALAIQGLSQLAYEDDDIADAIELNRAAIALDSLDNTAHFNILFQIAQMTLMEERYDESLAAVDEWLRLTGREDADKLALKGNALYRLERYDEAIAALNRAIAVSDKPQGTWYQLLIASYTDADRGAEAAEKIEGLMANDPGNKGLAQQAANLYIELDQHDKAAAVLRGAYDRGLLTTHEDLRSLWQLYAFIGQPDQTREIIEGGISRGIVREDWSVWKTLGDAYGNAERWAEAVAAYNKAAPGAPDGELDFLRGQLMIQETGQVAEGKAAIQTALSRGGLKREGDAWILLGMAENELGNTEAAVAAYRKAQGFESSRRMAESWLKAMRR
jgi:tetratricopeptide (TPR) repeat protein